MICSKDMLYIQSESSLFTPLQLDKNLHHLYALGYILQPLTQSLHNVTIVY